MAEGIPTAKTSLILSLEALPARGLKVITAPRPMEAITRIKYRQAMQLDRQVAIPAPKTSQPSGSSTNMNSGSRMIFNTPPRTMPVPASRERPTLRIRLDSTLDSTVGTPPATITQKAY